MYSGTWVDTSVFDNILVNPKMLSDHMPDTVLNALNQLVDRSVLPVSAAHHAPTDDNNPV